MKLSSAVMFAMQVRIHERFVSHKEAKTFSVSIKSHTFIPDRANRFSR